jgi:misacylated tRNA(Ala) deacylase
MTDDLFSRDSYLTTCDATVTAVGDDGVTLDRTVFYAQGGAPVGGR